MQCWRVYEEVRSSSELKSKLLTATSQRSLFVKIMERAMCDGELLIEDNFCSKGHDLKAMTTRGFFNCVAKNLTKDLTAAANPQVKKTSQETKDCETDKSVKYQVKTETVKSQPDAIKPLCKSFMTIMSHFSLLLVYG